jgi:asparagine synthase (glutamine-hydrolysing)
MVRRHRQRVLRQFDGLLSPGWGPSNGDETDHEDPLARLAFDTQEYEFGLRLPELLLMRIDRFSMANSVEARVPFLDPELIEFVYRLPISHKLVNGTSKVVLKKAISDIVPEWVVNRPKQGFGTPVDAWLQSRLGTLFERLIETDAVRTYFREDVLRTALHSANDGRGRTKMYLWPIVNFALWHRHWIEGESIQELVESEASAA